MGGVISVVVEISNVVINYIISTTVGVNNVETVAFDIGTFDGEENDWGLEEPAPFFELGFGYYLVAGVHFVEGIVDRIHG